MLAASALKREFEAFTASANVAATSRCATVPAAAASSPPAAVVKPVTCSADLPARPANRAASRRPAGSSTFSTAALSVGQSNSSPLAASYACIVPW